MKLFNSIKYVTDEKIKYLNFMNWFFIDYIYSLQSFNNWNVS